MAIDKKQQTKQEQRQPETRQETAKAAAIAPTQAEVDALRLSRDAALAELAEALKNKEPSEALTEALEAQEQGRADRPRRPYCVLTALKHLVRSKVPARLEEPLQGLITEIFCDPSRAPSKTTLDSLTLLRDLLASDHLHGDATHDISKAIEALA